MTRITEGDAGPLVTRFRPRRSLAWLALPLLAIALLGTACGGGDDEASPTATSTVGETELTVKMSDTLRFEPAQLTVTVGTPVVLTMDNTAGTTVHDFSVERIAVSDMEALRESEDMEHMGSGEPGEGMAADFDMHIAVDPGKMGTLMFTPDEAGEYTFFCSVYGHRDSGMEGKLVVS